MATASRLLFAALAVLIIATSQGVAGDDKLEFEEITAQDWAVQTDESKGIFDAVVLFEKWIADERKVEGDGCVYSLYRRVRILKETGREWADVEVPILEFDQRIEELKGHTVLPDGTIIELQKDHIFEQTAVKVGKEKVKQTRFSLPGLTDDCIIEYIIKIRTTFWNSEWVMQTSIPVLFAQKRWFFAKFSLPFFSVNYDVRELAASLFPNYLWQNCGPNVRTSVFPDPDKPAGLLLEADNIPAFKREPYGLPGDYLKARSLTYYGTNDPPQQYCVELSTKVGEFLEEYSKKDKRLRNLVPQFDSIADTLARIDAAYRWCQTNLVNLSYDDVYESKGTDKEKKVKPKDVTSVDDVLKYGYGWKGDINKTFWALLRLMGFDASMVYYKDRSEDFFVSHAKYWQFDLSVVVVDIPGRGFHYYYPGNPCYPPRMLPWYAEGTDGLIPGADNPIFPFPFSEPDATSTERNFTLAITEDREVVGTMTDRATGHDAYDIRISLYDLDDQDKVKTLKEYYEKRLPTAKIDSVFWADVEPLDRPVTTSVGLTFPDLDLQGKRIMIKPLDYASNTTNPFLATTREHPVLFNYAGSVSETVTLALPAGFAVEALPSDSTFKNLVGSCSVSFRQTGNHLVTTRVFSLGWPFFKFDFYPAVRELFQAQQEMSDRLLLLQKVEASGSLN